MLCYIAKMLPNLESKYIILISLHGARTLGWLRVRGTFGIGGAPRGARASPRLTRRRARPATLRSPLAIPQPIVVERGSAGR